MKPIVSLFGVGILATTYYFLAKAKKPVETEYFENPNDPIPVTLNQNLVLQLGSKGQEVAKLQSYMGVPSDGIFGPITEAKLYKLKAVKKTSIKQFLSTPTINQKILKVGTNVMAKVKTGTKIYNAIAKADTSYYSDNKVVKTIDYGKEIGKIRSANPAGNWYSVYYSDFPFGQKVGFVLATDIEKF